MRQLARTLTDHIPFMSPLSWWNAIARNVQSLRRAGIVENRQHARYRFQQVGTYPAPVAAFIEPFENAMFEAPDHRLYP